MTIMFNKLNYGEKYKIVVIAVDNIARELSENNDVVYFTGKVTDRNYLSALYLRSNLY